VRCRLAHRVVCVVDGRTVPATKFYMPPTNFGQDAPHLRRCRYEIRMPLEAFFEVLGQPFDRFIDELKHHEPHSEFGDLVAFQGLGYPRLREMIDGAPVLLGDLVCSWWLHEPLLNALSTWGPAPGYSFNSLDEVSFEDERVELRGWVFCVP